MARDRGQGDCGDGCGAAPDVGGAVLQARRATDADHVGRPRDDGVCAACGDWGEDCLSRQGSVGDRWGWWVPDDGGGAFDRGAGGAGSEYRGGEQRLSGDGTAVAGILLREELPVDTAA